MRRLYYPLAVILLAGSFYLLAGPGDFKSPVLALPFVVLFLGGLFQTWRLRDRDEGPSVRNFISAVLLGALLGYVVAVAIPGGWHLFLMMLVTGVLVGGIYALVALGWVIIYKCSGVLNLAMGELTIIGAYVTLSFYAAGVPFVPAVILTLVVGCILGLLTERVFLDRLIGEPILSVIMVTVGLSFFFKGLVGFIFGSDTRVFAPPVFSIEPISIGFLKLSSAYLWSFILSLVLLVLLVAFFKYTRWGLSMQATADDETAALSLGVSARFVYAASWAIAFMAAGVGGALLGNINGINVSVGYLGLLVLPAVVLGGLNSIPGAIVGGITIGVLQNFAGTYLDDKFPGSVKDIAPFVFMAVFLLFKPYGLWGWERIERV